MRVCPLVAVVAFTACNKGSDTEWVDPRVETDVAAGVTVSKVALYQGLEVPLMEDGELVGKGERPVPVLQGRDAMIRVFLTREEGFEDRDLRGVLVLETGDGQEVVDDRSGFVDGDSKQGQLNTTFNFDVPGIWIDDGTSWSVEIHEASSDVSYDGSTDGAVFPAAGSEEPLVPLKASPTDSIEIVLIPVRYNADGSGRLPDTGKEQQRRFKKLVKSMYPVSDVEITVGEPLDWSQKIEANGTGWDGLLTKIAGMRQRADEDANTYYYGLFNAAPSFGQFCGYGCVLGLSLVGRAQDVWSRASIGIGYTGQDSVETLAHEVGHAHGRTHAPCGLYGQPSDPYFPNNDASIEVWGYSGVEDELYSPSSSADLMSYCDPMWISDYSYNGIHERVSALADKRRSAPLADGRRWRRIVIDAEGQPVDAPELVLDGRPGGESRPVRFAGPLGEPVEVEGLFTPYSHLDGGWLWVPADAPVEPERIAL